MPCLALRGVGESIAASPSLRAKILLLNSYSDRETDGYTAVEYISAVVKTLQTRNFSRSNPFAPSLVAEYPVTAYITHLIYLDESKVVVDEEAIQAMGIRCIAVKDDNVAPLRRGEVPKFDASTVRQALELIIKESS